MKDFDFDKLGIGILLGLLCPVLAIFVYYEISFSYMTISEFINHIRLGDSYTAIISLSVIVNLAAFYPFIWKSKYLAARGVLGATIVWAMLVVFLKFFT